MSEAPARDVNQSSRVENAFPHAIESNAVGQRPRIRRPFQRGRENHHQAVGCIAQPRGHREKLRFGGSLPRQDGPDASAGSRPKPCLLQRLAAERAIRHHVGAVGEGHYRFRAGDEATVPVSGRHAHFERAGKAECRIRAHPLAEVHFGVGQVVLQDPRYLDRHACRDGCRSGCCGRGGTGTIAPSSQAARNTKVQALVRRNFFTLSQASRVASLSRATPTVRSEPGRYSCSSRMLWLVTSTISPSQPGGGWQGLAS